LAARRQRPTAWKRLLRERAKQKSASSLWVKWAFCRATLAPNFLIRRAA
jgi:hypothetical protein